MDCRNDQTGNGPCTTMIPKLEWRKMTREQKNAAFAEIICGRTEIRPMLSRPWSVRRLGRRAGGTSNCCSVPDYFTDANAVLPWLEKWPGVNCCHWGDWTVDLYEDKSAGEDFDCVQKGTGEAPTFCEAAMLALLRSAGAEVE